LARQVAGVDVAQTGGAARLRGAQQGGGGGVVRRQHLVILVKCRHVPGDIGRDAGQEFGRGAQFLARIVEAGDHQGDHFQPEAMAWMRAMESRMGAKPAWRAARNTATAHSAVISGSL
jgi:hypothetical protein